MSSHLLQRFTQPLLNWFDAHGRRNLPWQHPQSPYRVYVSEIMLQQTQVKTVLPYFERFMQRFPTLTSLALASEDEVLAHWAGLGYYSRARNLHKSAQLVVEIYQGDLPCDPLLLTQLPGVGPSTAAAIASLAFQQPVAILDGNVKRVLARYFMIQEEINKKKTETLLYSYAQACMSTSRPADYTQAIMDLGALCCRRTQPHCNLCPLKSTCLAYQHKCTELLPLKSKKKPIPTEEAQFLLIYRSHPNNSATYQIHLEKRPSTGIWGGLWCLPQLSMSQSIPSFLAHTFNLAYLTITPLNPLKHTFTHFHLHLHPYLISALNEPNGALNWFTSAQLTTLGVPKPITQLLTEFFDQHPNSLLLKSKGHKPQVNKAKRAQYGTKLSKPTVITNPH